ncbi:MAG: transposase [Ktedonobacteraceae bacterium]
MLNEREMNVNERRKYIQLMKPRYLKARKMERGKLLHEMEQVTGMHRKSLTRLLNATSLERKKRRKQRQRSYGTEVEQVIVCVWESLDYMCAERLTPSLLRTAKHLERFGVLTLSSVLEEQLQTISRASVARLLVRHRSSQRRLPRKGPERANQVTKGVPMGRIAWNTTDPGHFEVDLVFHSGPSVMGEHMHTLQLIDVATGWSERVAILGRGQQAMVAGFERVLVRLPFAVLELHPDNGTEFFNAHLVRFWKEKVVGVQLTRSRPYHKNDNRLVEQKNDSLVRQYFGNVRLDTVAQWTLMNEIYELMWLYYNLFQPVLHLQEKVTVNDKVRRKWDQAQTPYERLKATSVLSGAQRHHLETLYVQTNPRQLRTEIYQRLDQLWSLVATTTESAA